MLKRTIDGKSFSYNLTAAKGPTVVLETGLGAESGEWAAVQVSLADRASVFCYDRLGRGDSDPVTSPRTSDEMVADLRHLLSAVGAEPPYVLVGHSFGGLIVQQFAKHYSDDVEGLVLVESVHAAQFERLGPLFPLPHPSEDPRLADMRDFWTEGWKIPTSTRERIDFRLSLGSLLGAGALGDTPLRILTTGSFLHIPFLPPSARANLQIAWIELQKDFLELSLDSVSTHWPSSSHFLQRDNPHAITAAVCDLISGKPVKK